MDQRLAKRLLIEDGAKAAASALIHGYTLGGNITVPLIIKSYYSDIQKEIIQILKDENKLIEYFNRGQVEHFVNLVLTTISDGFLHVYRHILKNTDYYTEEYVKDNFISDYQSTIEKDSSIKTNTFPKDEKTTIGYNPRTINLIDINTLVPQRINFFDHNDKAHDELTVINSAYTDILILETVYSIMNLILNTDKLIVNLKKTDSGTVIR